MGCMEEASLRRIKAEHLKKRGDVALVDGNHREAWLRYTEALAIGSKSGSMHRILANRSLAYLRAQRYEEALADGLAAVQAAPKWDKAHWRAGAALLAMRRVPEAVTAFHRCWKCSGGDAACEAMLWTAVQRLTREQLGCGIIALCSGLEKEGGLKAPSAEEVTQLEAEEAWFKILSKAHKGQSKPGRYYERYMGWLKGSFPPHEAYLERAGMYHIAGAYLQAREDAQAAADTADALAQVVTTGDGALKTALVSAYLQLGEAFAADKGHEDRDACKAAQAFAMGLDLDPGHEALREGLQRVSEDLSSAQLKQVGEAVYEGATAKGRVLQNPTAYGVLEARAVGERLYRLDVSLDFPEAKPRAFGAAQRDTLRSAVAAAAGVDKIKVMIDHVRAPTKGRPVLEVHFQVQLGAEAGKGHMLAAAIKADAASVLGDTSLTDGLGPVDADTLFASVADVTSVAGAGGIQADRSISSPGGGCGGGDGHIGADFAGESSDRRLLPLPRPKMELTLPYSAYKLVRADGSAAERVDKHPFCMSRVYYDANERPEEVWAEMADGSCRWRQTGSEIKIIALKVPREVPPRDVRITFEPYLLKGKPPFSLRPKFRDMNCI